MTADGSARPPQLRQTAYPYDATAPADGRPSCSGWDARIDRLLDLGHRFLPLTFEPGGVLFRGMSTGVGEALAAGRFGRFEDPRALCALEGQLQVTLCSQDLSDALAVARLWESGQGAVLAFPSEVFLGEWQARRAAVLAFAEPGVVFRYPFLLRALEAAEVCALVLAEETAEALGQGVRPPPLVLPGALRGDRGATERAVRALLAERGLRPARLCQTEQWPRR